MAVIRANDLEKRYGDVAALSGFSVEVERGDVYGLLGPNGAGKTTTIRVLTGQITPDSGTVEVLDTDPVTDPLETRASVGILPEKQSPPSFLTPREYFDFVGEVRGLDAEVVTDRALEWGERLSFRDKLDHLSTDLSRGQQQKVMITQAFLHEPDVVFIDEPLANLDPLVQEVLKRYFAAYAAAGNALFLSTHNIDVAEAICSRVGIVADGTVIEEETLPTDATGSLLETFLDRVGATDAIPPDTPDEGGEDGSKPSTTAIGSPAPESE